MLGGGNQLTDGSSSFALSRICCFFINHVLLLGCYRYAQASTGRIYQEIRLSDIHSSPGVVWCGLLCAPFLFIEFPWASSVTFTSSSFHHQARPPRFFACQLRGVSAATNQASHYYASLLCGMWCSCISATKMLLTISVYEKYSSSLSQYLVERAFMKVIL